MEGRERAGSEQPQPRRGRGIAHRRRRAGHFHVVLGGEDGGRDQAGSSEVITGTFNRTTPSFPCLLSLRWLTPTFRRDCPTPALSSRAQCLAVCRQQTRQDSRAPGAPSRYVPPRHTQHLSWLLRRELAQLHEAAEFSMFGMPHDPETSSQQLPLQASLSISGSPNPENLVFYSRT